jgi:hypothetical protein
LTAGVNVTAKPGAASVVAQSAYLWFPQEPHFSLSSAHLEVHASARLSDKGDRLTVGLTFRDEWGWTFDEGRQEAENAWNVVLTELVQQGMVLDVGEHAIPRYFLDRLVGRNGEVMLNNALAHRPGKHRRQGGARAVGRDMSMSVGDFRNLGGSSARSTPTRSG